MLRIIARLIKAMNSEADPGQIALALTLSVVFGFTPFWGVQNLLVVLLVLMLRVNVSAFIVGAVVFTALGAALAPVFHPVGYWLLSLGALEGLWTLLYNTALFRLMRFNNTVVMGALFTSLMLAAPLYFVFKRLVTAYRTLVLERVKKTRIAAVVRGTKLYRIYRACDKAGGGL